MPKLNTSNAIAAALNKDRSVRTSSRKVCSAADSPVKDSREVDSLAGSERQAQHLHCRGHGAGKQQAHQQCREGIISHRRKRDFTDCPCGLSNLFFRVRTTGVAKEEPIEL